jgi:hypothetical protein
VTDLEEPVKRTLLTTLVLPIVGFLVHSMPLTSYLEKQLNALQVKVMLILSGLTNYLILKNLKIGRQVKVKHKTSDKRLVI